MTTPRGHSHNTPNGIAGTSADIGRIPAPRAPCGEPDVASTAHAWFTAVLEAAGLHRCGVKWQCPAHGHTKGHSASLALGRRDDGTGAWVHCHAGCTLTAVLDALGLRPAHLTRPPRITPTRYVHLRRLHRDWPPLTTHPGCDPTTAGFRHETWHPYGPDHRKERLRRPTDGAKTLRWESRNPHGEWVPGLLGTREVDLPLYREPEIAMAAAAGETVILCESESSCDALYGWYATTWAGGAASPPLEHLAQVLRGVDVVVIPDHDDAGLACLQRITGALPDARVLLGGPGEDAKDLHRRVGPSAFADLVQAAALWR